MSTYPTHMFECINCGKTIGRLEKNFACPKCGFTTAFTSFADWLKTVDQNFGLNTETEKSLNERWNAFFQPIDDEYLQTKLIRWNESANEYELHEVGCDCDICIPDSSPSDSSSSKSIKGFYADPRRKSREIPKPKPKPKPDQIGHKDTERDFDSEKFSELWWAETREKSRENKIVRGSTKDTNRPFGCHPLIYYGIVIVVAIYIFFSGDMGWFLGWICGGFGLHFLWAIIREWD